MYHTVLFDLDGTLTDPGLGITNSVMYALRKWNIEVEDRRELYRFIGPPLSESFCRYYGFSEEDKWKAVEYYREYFRDRGLFENEVYEGVVAMLKALRDAGKRIMLATSKPEEFAIRILKHFDLYDYFDFVGGGSMDDSRSSKGDVIAYVLHSCGITSSEGVLMVGDREHDVIGAKAHKIDCVGVLYGYGSREELESAGAVAIAKDPVEILNFVL